MSLYNIKRNLERHNLENPPRDAIRTRKVQVSLLLVFVGCSRPLGGPFPVFLGISAVGWPIVTFPGVPTLCFGEHLPTRR